MERKNNIFSFRSRLPIYGSHLSRSLRRNCIDSLDFVQRLSLEKKLEVHHGCVNTICWDETGSVILSGSDDKKLCITDPFANRVLAQAASGHRSNIFSAQFLPFCQNNQVVSCSGDGQISYTIMDREDTHGTNMFLCHYGTTYEVATVPGDPHTFLSCGEDGSVRWFDLRTKTSCTKDRCKDDILINCRRAVTTLAVNPMQPYHLAVGCSDSSVRVFDRRVLGTRAQGSSYSGRGIHAMFSRLCPPHMMKKYSRPTSLNYDRNGEEILVSYSTDYIYIFNLRDDDVEKESAIEEAEDMEPAKAKNGEQGDSVNPVKRLRLRGDWSDTGPKARPRSERDGPEGEDEPPPRVSIVQRMSDMLSRWLEDTTPQQARTLTDERRTSGDQEQEGEQTPRQSETDRVKLAASLGGSTSNNVQLRTVRAEESASSATPEQQGVDNPEETIGGPKEKRRKRGEGSTASADPFKLAKGREGRSDRKRSKDLSKDGQDVDERGTTGGTSSGSARNKTGDRGTKLKRPPKEDRMKDDRGSRDAETRREQGQSLNEGERNSENGGDSKRPPKVESESSEVLDKMEVEGGDDDDESYSGDVDVRFREKSDEGHLPGDIRDGARQHVGESTNVRGSRTVDDQESGDPDKRKDYPGERDAGPREAIGESKQDTGECRLEDVSLDVREEIEVGDGEGCVPSRGSEMRVESEETEVVTLREGVSDRRDGRSLGPETVASVVQDREGSMTESGTGKEEGGKSGTAEEKESVDGKKHNENEDTCLPLKERQEDWNPKGRATRQFLDPQPGPSRRRKVSVSGVPGQVPSNRDSTESSTSENPQTQAEESVSDLRSRFESGNVVPPARPRPRRVSPSRRLPTFSREVMVNTIDMDMSDTDSEFDSEDDLVLRRPRHSSSSTEERDPDAAPREGAAASKTSRLKEFFKNHRLRKEREEAEMLRKVKAPKVKMVFKGHRNSRTMIKEATFWGDNHVLSGSDCGHIFIWDRHTGQLVMLLEGDKHVVNCIQPHPTDPILATSGIDYDIKIWTPSAEAPQMPSDAKEVIRINEVMLEETRDTITIPPSFMLRMLASLNHLRTDSRATGEGPDSDSSDE